MKVSICIPAYNNNNSLKRCLESIFSQDFQDYEIVITDDSPSNMISELIKEYNRPEIKYYKNLISLGSPKNWNAAIAKASGEYIKIMHHDDWFSTTSSLRKFVLLLDNNPDVIFASSACCDISEDMKKSDYFIREKDKKRIEKKPIYLLKGNYIGAPSVTIFRNNQGIIFDKNLIWLVDIDFYIRFFQRERHFATTSESLINIGVSPTQITESCKNDKTLILSEFVYLNEKLNGQNEKNVHDLILQQFVKNRVHNNEQLSFLLNKNIAFFNPSDSASILFFRIKYLLKQIVRMIKRKIDKLWK